MRETNIKDLKLFYRGKARDIYEPEEDKLLIISTDRISCFDFVLPTVIPEKGKILNKMSVFWFNYLDDIIPNHLLFTEWRDIKKYFKNEPDPDIYRDRCVVARKLKRINIECVVRGYISGSAWKEYSSTGTVSGVKFPPGMKESEKFPEPVFTPSIKSMSGHDINITEEQMMLNEGEKTTAYLKEVCLQLYKKAFKYAYKRGIIIADTKFEFGILGNNIIMLIDEIFTPDSSRFWDAESYKPGQPQDSYDKQFVRDYLESIKWNKKPPVPELPEDIVKKTKEKYEQAYKKLIEE